MALASNEVIGRDGVQLARFSPSLSPRSQGVNLFCQDLGKMDNMSNPYVFPPFGLRGPVLKFLYRFGIPFIMVVPVYLPHPYWWPEQMACSSAGICLGTLGDMGALQVPWRSGYTRFPCPHSLWAFRVSPFFRFCVFIALLWGVVTNQFFCDPIYSKTKGKNKGEKQTKKMFFDTRTCIFLCFLWVFYISIFPFFLPNTRCQSCLPLRWPAQSVRMLMMKIFVFINGVGTQGGMFLSQILLIETRLPIETTVFP